MKTGKPRVLLYREIRLRKSKLREMTFLCFYLASVDAFITTEYDEDYSLTPCIAYTYYYNGNYYYGWYYFEEYLVNHGFEKSLVYGLDEDDYYVYTAEFEYDGETHTVTVVEARLGYSSDYSGYELLYYVKIDLDLSAFSSPAAE